MKTFAEWLDQYISKSTIKQLLTVVLVLLIVLLLGLTWSTWTGLFKLIKVILKPFVFGFAFAYVIRPAVTFFEKHRIKRSISVPVLILGMILGFGFLFASFIPNMMVDLGDLIRNFGDGIQSLYTIYIEEIDMVPSPIIKNVVDQVVAFSNELFKTIPNIPNLLGDSINVVISVITNFLFSFVIGLYFVMDYERVTAAIHKYTSTHAPRVDASITVINQAIRTYFKSLFVVMLVTFVEYTVFYFIAGQKYALVLGLLSAVALLIPYVGGMAMNVVGFISSLGLGVDRIILISVGLLILPNIDTYFITPLVYKKRNQTNPLWSLFSFFACATLFGFWGVLISTPLYFSVRAVLNLRKHDWSLERLENGV